MASDLTVQTIRGPASGINANKVLIPTGQTLTLEDKLAYGNLPAGSILQIVTNYPTTAWMAAQSVSSYTEISAAYRTSITPRYSNSKLILEWTGLIGGNATGAISTMKFRDITNNVDAGLSGLSLGSRGIGHASFRQVDTDSNDRDNSTMRAVIDAGSTASREYSIFHYSESAATKYFNATATDNSGCSYVQWSFTITEVAQ